MFILNERKVKVNNEIIKLYKDVCPSTVGHMQDKGFIRNLKPLQENNKLVGTAVTVSIPHLDSTAVHKVFDIVEEGDILVIDTNKDYERAPFGELVCYMAKAAKLGGVIIDGCITDVKAIKALGVNVWYRNISPLTTRIKGIEGFINIPVAIDNVVINAGDLIVADDDGILVLNPDIDDVLTIAKTAIQKQNAEADIKAKIDSGIKLGAITGASKYFGE